MKQNITIPDCAMCEQRRHCLQVLDPALTRPGRLSRRVVVPLPDERGRADILAVHMRLIPLAPELDRSSACRALAKITGGFSGAELANVVNEAALLAGRKEAEVGCQLGPFRVGQMLMFTDLSEVSNKLCMHTTAVLYACQPSAALMFLSL